MLTILCAAFMMSLQSETIRLSTPAAEKTAEATERFVDITLAKGRVRGAVVVFFEPKTRLFSWVFAFAGDGSRPDLLGRYRQSSLLYLVDEQLVFFTVREQSLAVRISTERAASLSDAVSKAVASAEARKSELVKPELLFRGPDLAAYVSLKEIEPDFFLLKNNAAPAPPLEVIAASFADGKWEVTLKGPNKDRVVLTLDAAFKLQGIRRLD
jgi:hypothetical protein